MKVSIDTNVLARAILQDESAQSLRARELLREATLIAAARCLTTARGNEPTCC